MFNFRHNPKHREISLGQILTVTLVLGLLSLGTAESFGSIIKLREERCSPSGNVVTLGDVAEVLDSDPNRVRGLQQIILAPAPAPGGELLFDHQQIRSRLQAVGINPLDLEFAGQSRVWVSGGGERPGNSRIPQNVTLTQQQKAQSLVEEAVSRSLSQRYPQAGRFQVVARLNEQQASAILQADSARIAATGGMPPFQQEQNYLVQFVSKEGKQDVMQVVCSANIVPRVLAVMHPISRGQIVRIEDLGWRNPTDQELKRLPVTQPQQVIGREATRDLQTADAITADNVRMVPLVSSGETITVFSRKGGVTVRIDVKSLGTAGLGESVVVHGPDGRSKLTARVTGYHEAEITDESPERVQTIGAISGIATQNQFSGTGGYAR